MKKIFKLVALLLVFACILSACGRDDVPTIDDDSSSATSTTTGSAVNADVTSTTTAAPSEESTTAPVQDEPSTRAPSVKPVAPSKNTETATTTAASRTTTIPTTQIDDPAFDDRNTATKILNLAGFAYDAENDLFYSTIQPWQRNFGFNIIYDIAAPRTGMIYSTERIYFDYGGKNWMCQLWKGQYGITVGAEIGMYYKPVERKIAHYDCVSDEDLVMMQMDVYKGGEFYFSRGPEKHWWLTGFKLLDVTAVIELRLQCAITWESDGLADAFEIGLLQGIKGSLSTPYRFTRNGNTFNITW